jgi:hypothetical protein
MPISVIVTAILFFYSMARKTTLPRFQAAAKPALVFSMINPRCNSSKGP